jgi:endonuclease/exonuclease/phosphatase (EEP) superfamily protein YafD
MFTVLITASFLIAIATALPETRFTHWIVRGLDFPRIQIVAFGIVVLLLLLLVGNSGHSLYWACVVMVATSLGWQLKWVLPYTPLWKKEVRKTTIQGLDNQVSIIMANVLTPNHDSAKLISLVRDYKPDILVTLESDKWWEQQLDVLEDEMPHTLKCPLDNLYGMHLYSRLPLSDSAIEYLVKDDIPSMHACVTLRSGVEVRMHFMHPEPPSPTESEVSSPRDAELAILARSIADSDEPLIVTGDLNDVAWSPTTRLFRHISGLLDPRIGRGAFNTFHADFPFLRWPLDHVFHSHHFTLSQLERLPHIGSDHFSLYTALNYTPQKGKEQEGESADQEDRERAEEAVTEEDVEKQDVPNPIKGA